MSSFDNLSSHEQYICDLVSVCCAGISLSCSCMTLWLIFALKKRNGYVLLISSLCCSELIYDISCCLSFSHAAWLCKLKNAGIFVGGFGVSLWSLIIAAVVLYMVTYLKPVRIADMYPVFFLCAVIAPFILAFYDFDHEFELHCSGGLNKESWDIGQLYTYGRIACALMSIVVYALMTYKINQMHKRVPEASSSSIEALCARMKYYVLVQLFIRAVPTYTQVIRPNSPFALQLISSICAPLSGLGYFMVFMFIHPGAALLFLSYFRCIELVPLNASGNRSGKPRTVEEASVTVDCALLPVCVLEWMCCYCHEMGAISDAASDDKHRFGKYSSGRSNRSWVGGGTARGVGGGDEATVSLLRDTPVGSLCPHGLDAQEGEFGAEGAEECEDVERGVAGQMPIYRGDDCATESADGSRGGSGCDDGILLSQSDGSRNELMEAAAGRHLSDHSVISYVTAASSLGQVRGQGTSSGYVPPGEDPN